MCILVYAPTNVNGNKWRNWTPSGNNGGSPNTRAWTRYAKPSQETLPYLLMKVRLEFPSCLQGLFTCTCTCSYRHRGPLNTCTQSCCEYNTIDRHLHVNDQILDNLELPDYLTLFHIPRLSNPTYMYIPFNQLRPRPRRISVCVCV